MFTRAAELDFLAYKIKSSDSDAFVEAAKAYSKKSIVFVYDFDKIKVAYAGDNIDISRRDIAFIKTKNHRLNHYLSPFLLFFQMFTYLYVIGTVCWKYRPKVCWVENAFVGVLIGILRKCNFIGKSIYLPGDWLVNPHNKRFFSFIANNVLFPLVDYLSCCLNDVVLDHTMLITQARDRYWGRRLPKKQGWYFYRPHLDISLSEIHGTKKTLCFIGQMRRECGLDVAISALSSIRKTADIDLVVIGPKTMAYDYFYALAQKSGGSGHVHFHGYMENEQLAGIMKRSFCGLNVLTVKDSYSSYTIPGKLMHYIQHLLPIVVTQGIGAFADVVRERGLGEVIEPTKEEFARVVLQIYQKQLEYRKRIVEYISSLPDLCLKDYIDADTYAPLY